MHVVVLLVTGLLGLSTAPAVPPPPPKAWPAKGVCIAHVTRKRPCMKISPADAEAIRRAMLAYLDDGRIDDEPQLARARKLAEQPVTAHRIGGYHLVTVSDHDGAPTLHLTGSGGRHHQGVSVRLQRGNTGWKVVSMFLFSRHPVRR